MIVKTETTQARNRRLRKAEKEKQANSVEMLERFFHLPTMQQIESQFGHYPSRVHLELTAED